MSRISLSPVLNGNISSGLLVSIQAAAAQTGGLPGAKQVPTMERNREKQDLISLGIYPPSWSVYLRVLSHICHLSSTCWTKGSRCFIMPRNARRTLAMDNRLPHGPTAWTAELPGKDGTHECVPECAPVSPSVPLSVSLSVSLSAWSCMDRICTSAGEAGISPGRPDKCD